MGRNAWDPDRTPGGSSGGAGAATAADLVPVALGTDTGGSVRVPAALNGVSGLRPTAGLVSNRGTIPVAWTFDTVGPLARRIEDVARVLEVIQGHDPEDPASADRPGDGYEQAMAEGAEGLRIGLLGGDFRLGLPAETIAVLDAAAATMERLGARVEPVELSGIEVAIELTADLMLAEAAAFHAERLAERPDGFAPDVQTRLRRGGAITGPQYGRGRQEQRAWTRQVTTALAGLDLLLAPAAPIPAPLIAENGTPPRNPELSTGPTGAPEAHGSSQMATQDDYVNTAAILREVGKVAGSSGLNITIEVHQHSIADNSWSTLHLLELTDSPHVFANPDLGNVYWNYDVPEETSEECIMSPRTGGT